MDRLATGAMARISWRRLLLGHGDEVEYESQLPEVSSSSQRSIGKQGSQGQKSRLIYALIPCCC